MNVQALMNHLEDIGAERDVIVRVEVFGVTGVFDVTGAHVLNSSSDEPLFCVLEIRERPDEVPA